MPKNPLPNARRDSTAPSLHTLYPSWLRRQPGSCVGSSASCIGVALRVGCTQRAVGQVGDVELIQASHGRARRGALRGLALITCALLVSVISAAKTVHGIGQSTSSP